MLKKGKKNKFDMKIKKLFSIMRMFMKEPITYLCNAKVIIEEKRNKEIKEVAENKLYTEIISYKRELVQKNEKYKSYLDIIQKRKKVSVYNSVFEDKYDKACIVVNKEKHSGYKYVTYNGHNLYYPRFSRTEWIKVYHNSIMLEQDRESPHRYLELNESLRDYIVFDLGAAEGNFSLAVMDSIKHVYLFEGDKRWIGPLNRTFQPWKEKITIINKNVSNKKKKEEVKLSEYINELLLLNKITCEDSLFIKMDIEGNEEDIFDDLKEIIKQFKNLKMAICLYHHQGAEYHIIKNIPLYCKYMVRDGYMIFKDDQLKFPFFRHGILRIEKNENYEEANI